MNFIWSLELGIYKLLRIRRASCSFWNVIPSSNVNFFSNVFSMH